LLGVQPNLGFDTILELLGKLDPNTMLEIS
jgi:hypothetical protein